MHIFCTLNKTKELKLFVTNKSTKNVDLVECLDAPYLSYSIKHAPKQCMYSLEMEQQYHSILQNKLWF